MALSIHLHVQAERHLSDMVVAKALTARIDRPAGVVRFAPRKAPAELLNGWARSIGRLLDIVEKSTQNIQKESMVHKVPIGAG
jgi:26S proteasome regulatory subunit N5